jgi:ribose transport system substrate-binding protein
MRKTSMLCGVAVAIGALLGFANPTLASSAEPVIGLANGYYGNTWRHQMVESFETAAKQAKAEGLIRGYMVLNGDGTVAQQNSQMAELILKHVDAIVINAVSESAVNGMIQRACHAGILVISFDSIASAPCAYQLSTNFVAFMKTETQQVMKLIGGKGNIIVVRGAVGSAPDHDMYEGQQLILKNYPDVKTVATVYGQVSASAAQSAIANVLPSLPHVDAVLGQGGGDDIGIVQAFQQFGGPYADKMPVIGGGGGSNFISWWAQQKAKSGYQTISLSPTPGVGGAVLWLALAVLKGAKVPHAMIMPPAVVTQDNVDQYKDLPPGTIVSPVYTADWVQQNLVAKK